ncbi:hypothetical protein CFIMG_000372RA [Ceratocystis fimbriata CBS 114723]|uniref:SYO1-like TPR repeats domain-containing protein n=1 Tax=Ceratocystis fimbriata CBS 114723 TaxID=1035309 RepID=A0A2C5XN16_9PEZI|nr:hypothetical protein CFIMG_000372RA [Ceratocystis fimbriata CBS 114723]
MGKSRPNRQQRRKDPARQPKLPNDPELLALRDEKVLPVLKDLQATNPKSRSAAASAVANAITDEKVRKLMLREQLVRIVMSETLTDASVDSRASGWEIMKILAEEEDDGFSVHLFRQDILVAVEYACTTILETLESKETPFTSATREQQTIVWRISRALCGLVTRMAEASEEIWAKIVSSVKVTNFLLTLVSRESTDPNTADEVMTCLMTLTEDNREMCEQILATPEAFPLLMKLKELDGATSVLACGVLHNIFEAMEWNDLSPGKDDATDEALIRRLARTLQDYEGGGPKPLEGQEWNAPGEIVKLALEILASIGTAVISTFDAPKGLKGGRPNANEDSEMMDEDGADNEEIEEDDLSDSGAKGDQGEDDDDSMDEEEMLEDLQNVTGANDDEGIEDLPTLAAVLQKAAPQIIRLGALKTDSEEHIRVKSHAISVLNNIAWSISCLDFSNGKSASIRAAWTPVASRIWEQNIVTTLAMDTADIELATNITSLAWAVARVLRENLPYTGGEHTKFIALYHASKSLSGAAESTQPAEKADKKPAEGTPSADPFQGLGVKCIGVLGQLALPPVPVSRNRDIGVFLMTLLSKLPEVPVADAVEILNSIFDIYADEDQDIDAEVFWKDNFLKHLEDNTGNVKMLLKRVHKKDPATAELRARVEESVMNFTRFVAYKKKHQPKA